MKTLQDRFFKWVILIPFHECWEWVGSSYNGYGKFNTGKKKIKWAHRISYEIFKGKVPKNLHIDHVCKNRSCVNPNHLEAVTQKINNIRAWTIHRKRYCPSGHEFTKENTDFSQKWRRCKECHRIDSKKRYHQIKQLEPPYPHHQL